MYEIIYRPDVVKNDIRKLSLPVRKRIKKAIDKKLMINPIGFGKPFRNSLKGLRRLRIDDYRVIYKIRDNNQVEIVRIAHRKEAY